MKNTINVSKRIQIRRISLGILVGVLGLSLTSCSSATAASQAHSQAHTATASTAYEKDSVAPTAAETMSPVTKETEGLSNIETQAPTEKETQAPTKKETQAPTEKKTNAPSATTSTEAIYNVGTGTGIGGGNITGNCICEKRALPIYSVRTTAKRVALSFNTAWGADDMIQILNILDKYNIKTTFFMTGKWVSRYPDMVKEILKRGHDLGSHGLNHVRMSKISIAEQQKEIVTLTESVRKLTGYEMYLFRPPYGDYNSALINTAYGCNYYPVQWSVDSLDWKNYGTEHLISTVINHKNLRNGAIIQLHNDTKYTATALETIIVKLQQKGYSIVPVSQLIIRSNFHMAGDGTQIAN